MKNIRMLAAAVLVVLLAAAGWAQPPARRAAKYEVWSASAELAELGGLSVSFGMNVTTGTLTYDGAGIFTLNQDLNVAGDLATSGGLTGATVTSAGNLTFGGALMQGATTRISSGGSGTFADLSIGATSIVNSSRVLQNITGFDSGTAAVLETSAEANIDSLPYLTSIQGKTLQMNGTLGIYGNSMLNGDFTTTGTPLLNALKLQAGSTSLPAIRSYNEQLTGIYFPSDINIGFLIDGDERMTVSSAGVDVIGQLGEVTSFDATTTATLEAWAESEIDSLPGITTLPNLTTWGGNVTLVPGTTPVWTLGGSTADATIDAASGPATLNFDSAAYGWDIHLDSDNALEIYSDTLGANAMTISAAGAVALTTGTLTVPGYVYLNDGQRIYLNTNTDNDSWITATSAGITFRESNSTVANFSNASLIMNRQLQMKHDAIFNYSRVSNDFTVYDNSAGNMIFADSSADTLALKGVTIGLTGTTTVTGNATITGTAINFANLPTSEPATVGDLWNNGGAVTISNGP